MIMKDLNFLALALGAELIFIHFPLISFLGNYFVVLFLSFTSNPKKNILLTYVLLMLCLLPNLILSSNMSLDLMFMAFPEMAKILNNLQTRILMFMFYSLASLFSFLFSAYAARFTIKKLKLKERIGYF